jgi:hypothetical protein
MLSIDSGRISGEYDVDVRGVNKAAMAMPGISSIEWPPFNDVIYILFRVYTYLEWIRCFFTNKLCFFCFCNYSQKNSSKRTTTKDRMTQM